MAEKLYSEAFLLFPNKPDLRRNYANFLISNDIDIERGIALIQPLLSKDPDSYDCQFIFGLA